MYTSHTGILTLDWAEGERGKATCGLKTRHFLGLGHKQRCAGDRDPTVQRRWMNAVQRAWPVACTGHGVGKS